MLGNDKYFKKSIFIYVVNYKNVFLWFLEGELYDKNVICIYCIMRMIFIWGLLDRMV